MNEVYECDRCGHLHTREFSLLCRECEAEVEEEPLDDDDNVH